MPSAAPHAPGRRAKLALLAFIVVWFGFQILFPLRHWLYPGDVNWTEEGYMFSWRMMLRSKPAQGEFLVTHPPSGKQWRVSPYDLLPPHQAYRVGKFPDITLQFAHYLARFFEERHGYAGVEVRARICAALNGRKAELLYDPARDLAKEKRDWRPYDWVLPQTQPFEHPPNRTGRRKLDC